MTHSPRVSHFELFLFGKPEWEFPDGPMTQERLKALGEDLKDRLDAAARAVQVLKEDGWDVELVGYSLSFAHSSLTFPDDAAARTYLQKLGLDPETFEVFELEPEDEEDDEA
ncbi:MAG: hypothetical protein HY347_05695 [candidate division NC10 bacterium]|nr:hypothetical protein [candidate division NC10 bacterium]